MFLIKAQKIDLTDHTSSLPSTKFGVLQRICECSLGDIFFRERMISRIFVVLSYIYTLRLFREYAISILNEVLLCSIIKHYNIGMFFGIRRKNLGNIQKIWRC
ncbi:MAG: hypothetical protein ACTSVC_01955 [Promethearchaeota archaeon]